MSDNATTLKGKLRVGLTKWISGIALFVLGTIGVNGAYDTITKNEDGTRTGTATGQVLTIDGANARFRDVIPLVMTGGNATYNLALVRLSQYKITGSGMVTTAAVSWIRAPAGIRTDIATSKCASGATPTAATGTLLPNGNNILSATGGGVVGLVGTGSVRVNGADCIKVASLTAPTTSGSGYLIIEGFDDPSE